MKETPMSSTDIYSKKESPWEKAKQQDSAKSRRKRRRVASFDETVNKDISGTHRRRSKNNGFRRFTHLMKKPEYSKKVWVTTISIFSAILLGLIIWDLFLRYPGSEDELAPEQGVEEAVAE
jgi:hypothetical protein